MENTITAFSGGFLLIAGIIITLMYVLFPLIVIMQLSSIGSTLRMLRKDIENGKVDTANIKDNLFYLAETKRIEKGE